MTFNNKGSSSLLLLLSFFCLVLVAVKAHQVRVSFDFKDSISLDCVPRPLPFTLPQNVTTPASPNVQCYRQLTAVMIQQLNELIALHEQAWRQLHAECSPNAPFAFFLYLYTKNAVNRLQQGYFLCPQDIAYLLFQESQGYFNNLAAADPSLKLDATANASAVYLPWQDAFSFTATGLGTVYADFAVQANVFFSNEMTRALYAVCLTTKPYIFKTDYDKFNTDLPKLLATTTNAYRAFYDSTFTFPTSEASQIMSYREQAWADTTNERPNFEPARSTNEAQTLIRSDLLKIYQCNTFSCSLNPNPSDELIASFDP